MHKFCPPKPGTTVITTTKSIISIYLITSEILTFGCIAIPALQLLSFIFLIISAVLLLVTSG